MRNANVALLQLCSGDRVRDNLAQIEQQIKQLNAGVKLVMTPEKRPAVRQFRGLS